MSPITTVVVYSVLIVAASLAGGLLPSLVRLTHARMQLIVSFVAGLMLGVGLFHMLPHAAAQIGSIDRTMWWVVVGVLTMFFLLRTFHFHQHGPAQTSLSTQGQGEHGNVAGCQHDHGHGHHALSWVGVALGLSLHTLIDGMALAASVQTEALHGSSGWWLGLATFLAIVLHKPIDAVSITALMSAGGWAPLWRHAVNLAFAVMCPLGAVLLLFGVARVGDAEHLLLGCALAAAAGVFLCIALADLLPEIEFHSHDRGKLSALLLLGIAVSYGIGMVEPEHVHGHGAAGEGRSAETHGHDHDDHDHGGQATFHEHGLHGGGNAPQGLVMKPGARRGEAAGGAAADETALGGGVASGARSERQGTNR